MKIKTSCNLSVRAENSSMPLELLKEKEIKKKTIIFYLRTNHLCLIKNARIGKNKYFNRKR